MSSAAELIDAAWQARRDGRQDEAARTLVEAIDAARSAGEVRVLIHALGALAHVVRDAGDTGRALPLLDEAVALSRDQRDPVLLAHAVRHLGDLHRESGRLVDADTCYVEALSLYRQAAAPPPLDVANALRPAALLKEQQGDRHAARQLWGEAKALYAAAGISEAVAECTRRLTKLSDEPSS